MKKIDLLVITKASTAGITLVALVVTIVVLIILATISISIIFSEDGIMARARQTQEYQANADAQWEETNTNVIAYIDSAIENKEKEPELPDVTTAKAGEKVAKPLIWTNTNVAAIADGNGTAIPLPNGYYYIGGNRTDGLVISDKSTDTLTSSGTTSGNQFVWIPVTLDNFERTNFDSNGKPTDNAPADGENVTNCSEPYISGYSDGKGTEEIEEYNIMKTQVLLYGGFYIGRYEAGINSTETRTGVTNAQEVVVKKGVAPYNYVPWGVSMSDAGEISGQRGAVYLAKNKYTIPIEAQNAVTSTLCYGIQWDAMCRYIGDSQRDLATTGSVALTGNENDISKNIYDLAGNCREWTMEANSTSYRSRRGGYFNVSLSVSHRSGNLSPTNSNVDHSFRIALYISNSESE